MGGPEHATMHLLYFRFWTRVMKELGLSPVDEPVTRLITQGIVNGSDGQKMSKRFDNGGGALADLVKEYGADTARAYVLFAGPPERDFDWNDDGVDGAFRFLRRVWTLAANARGQGPGRDLGRALSRARRWRSAKAAHKALKRVTEAIERLSFNTAIAGIMEYVNALYALAKELTTPAEKAAMNEAIRLLTRGAGALRAALRQRAGREYGATAPLEEQRLAGLRPDAGRRRRHPLRGAGATASCAPR